MRKLFFLFFFLVTLFGQNYFRVITLSDRTYVYLEDIATYYYGTAQSVDTSKSVLKVGKTEVSIQANKKFILVDGIKIHLSHPVLLEKERLLFSKIDVVNLLDPLLRSRSVAPNNSKLKTIVLDPGHGGKDRGGKGARLAEKDFNLEFAFALKLSLEKHNYKVFLTRDEDYYLSLKERALLAKGHGADLFVSIHANVAAHSKAPNGIETYHLAPQGGEYGVRKIKKELELAHDFNRQNAKVAYEIQKQLIEYTKRKDRGVKYQNFAVFKTCNFPCSFIRIRISFKIFMKKIH